MAIAGIVLLAGCGHERTYPGAPIVLISIDTLRSDHLPAYGYKGVETPAIDALRADSVLALRAYSHYPITLPSHSSILSGLLPTQHGVRDNVGYLYDGEKHPTLARLLKGAGYETGGAVSTFILRRATGIASGFDFYEDSIEMRGGESLDQLQRPGGVTARLGLDWIRGRSGAEKKPFFFFLHLYEPHTPYTPPEPFRSRYRERPYDGEIATADSIVGDFLAELKALGIYDRAIVVLLSDHGEGLSEHGERQHGILLYRETLQVPLLLKLPGGEHKGESIAVPVGLFDVAPTLLALAGVPRPREMTGTPLLSLLGKGAPSRNIYSETFYPRLHLGWSDLASLIGDRYHYIEGPDPELYDLPRDPGEKVNRRDEERRTVAAFRADLKPYDRNLQAPRDDPETARKLASLGYLGGTVAASRGPLPDPKGQARVMGEIEDAFGHLAAGENEPAIASFKRLVAENPQMEDIWDHLGLALQKAGRHEEATAAFARALKLSHGAPSVAITAASSLIALGRLDEAKQHAELAMQANPSGATDILVQIAIARHDVPGALDLMKKAVDSGQAGPDLRRRYVLLLAGQGDPQRALAALQPLADRGDPEAINAVASALSDLGRNAEAEALLRKLATAQPQNARAHELLGMVALRLDRTAEARDELRRALDLDAKSASAWNTIGVALFRLEGPEAALAAWQKAVALDPTQYDALLNIGLVAAQAGRRAEAAEALKRFLATAPADHFGEDRVKARGLLREIGG